MLLESQRATIAAVATQLVHYRRNAGGAPVSRAVVLATASGSVLVQAMRAARRPMPVVAAAFEQLFVFRRPGELLFGVGLLYYFRQVVCMMPRS